jgi:hypothetical protein
VARAHGGRVDLHDNPGGGSLFRVLLPRRVKGAAEGSTAPIAAARDDAPQQQS